MRCKKSNEDLSAITWQGEQTLTKTVRNHPNIHNIAVKYLNWGDKFGLRDEVDTKKV